MSRSVLKGKDPRKDVYSTGRNYYKKNTVINTGCINNNPLDKIIKTVIIPGAGEILI